jgi:hypothetical protein
VENAAGDGAVLITRSLRLVGAGSGDDDATNAIVRPAISDEAVIAIRDVANVTVEGMRLTGGTGVNGRGLNIARSNVTLTGCTITGNVTGAKGGGFNVVDAQVILTNTVVIGNTGLDGGIAVEGVGASLTLDLASRVTGNTGTNRNGGIFASTPATVALPSVDSVTNNISSGANKNCGGSGTFTGPGAICTTT